MTQVSHFASGALAGAFAPDSASAVVLGVTAHLVLDRVPHYWPSTRRAKNRFILADYLAAILLLVALAMLDALQPGPMFWGLVGSAMVDIVLVGVPAARRSALGRWHSSRQPHRANPSWMWTDVGVTVVSVLGLLALVR